VLSPPLVETTCPGCGTRLPGTAPDDFGCMVCLFQLALTSPVEKAAASDRFGSYTITHLPDGSLQELGRGTMGVTFHAFDTALQRPVALKIIDTDLAQRSSEAQARFIREARVAASLRHPNIATVYQFGIREETGQCFCAMEFVEGETLEARVRRTGPLDLPATIAIARQVVAALGAAEERGLVHRDLKPANLMIAAGGTVKVIDFGVAKALAETPDVRQLTQGGFVGTPAFASPEQFTGAPVDVRSDIYSLGATLWYLLTGHLPFGDRAGGSAPPVGQLKAAHVPSPFISLLVSMLAIEPAARPNVHDLAARVEALQGRRKRAAIFAIAAVVIAGAAAAFYLSSSRAISSEKSIAVLPFENSSDEKTNAYFASGIHDDLLVNLARIASLKVISRDSVLPYQSGPRDLSAIGRALGVNAVLEGSVRRAGSRARINVQLIDAKSGTQIWAENYDREMKDAFDIQSDLAFQISSALKAKLSPGETARLRQPPTTNGEAYLLYIQANEYYAEPRKLKLDLEKAEQLYEKALQLDPSFALAWAQLSRLESVWHSYHPGPTGPDPARRAKAQATAREALRLQPDLPEGHMALAEDYWRGSVITADSDFDSALREFELARRGLPNEPDIYAGIGRIQRHQGKWTESIANLQKAALLDPKTPDRWHRVAGTYELTRNYAAADEALRRAMTLSPNRWEFELHQGYLNLYWKGDMTPLEHLRTPTGTGPDDLHTEDRFATKLLLRQYDDAEKILQQDGRDTFEWEVRGVPRAVLLGELFFQKGEKEKARAAFQSALPALERAEQMAPSEEGWPLLVAEAYAAMGRKEEVMQRCKRATEIMPEAKSAWYGGGVLATVAKIYAMLGDADHAVPILTHLLGVPSEVHRNSLRFDPAWDPIRRDPRFQKLLDASPPQPPALPATR
jgi:serine/threonine protein kinase